jgi:hypothetical protein
MVLQEQLESLRNYVLRHGAKDLSPASAALAQEWSWLIFCVSPFHRVLKPIHHQGNLEIFPC